MMQHAYLDESGIHKNASACVVAGYFGKKGPWRRFETAYRSVLKRFDVPLDEFHAKDVISKAGFFYRWSRDQQQEFLTSIGEVVRRSRIYPVCSGFFVADFFNLSEKQRKFVTGGTWDGKKFLTSGCPNKPYFVVFTECLKAVQKHVAGGQRAHFYCGIDRPAGEYAREVFGFYRTRPSANKKLGTIAFPHASEIPALQIADLFSYLTYQFMLERRQTKDWTAPPTEALAMLLFNRKAEGDTTLRDEKQLREMISVIPNMD